MKKYQLWEIRDNGNNAGTKAPLDVKKVATKFGFKTVNVIRKGEEKDIVSRTYRQIYFLNSWQKIYREIEPNSLLLLQVPFHDHELSRTSVLKKLKSKKNIKIIYIVHDVEELRKINDNNFYQREFNLMLNLADQIIVHNNVMMKFFIEKGVSTNKLINLEIFDYLNEESLELPTYSKEIFIAGNLDVRKVKYLSDLNKINASFTLYGSNFSLKEYKNINYKGSVKPDQLPHLLNKGFGLIWDGESISTCSGVFGQYLKYNNPHKLSLYLSSGLPVIIWDQAAEASFVKDKNLGIVISSLYDLPDVLDSISEEQYLELAYNVKKEAEKLKNGFYSEQALKKAIHRID
ncbi:Galactofuranose transferase [Lactobacillus johnsonii DPC 6026]|uniref:sugar transferase n=1 Tax=Lactobacillus johnsonii TaxID=33959 RepID=UPI000207BE11|nr:sugar transferase [Lactobacillus johnsonii]AEB93446.1 Galactofuranose transferase [Lactobacillus johnsonii DPC 6026]